MMVRFTKDQGSYRRLATEIVTAKLNLSNISMIGPDMDQGIKMDQPVLLVGQRV